jgi:hypothetical protein
VILSLLNGFAAWNAGALKEEYHVCGDDLVACWKRQTIHRYESNLEMLGLVVNKAKAFVGRRGVFCEMIVKPVTKGLWRAYNVGHLSEITGAKVRNHFTKNAFAVADHLRDVTILKPICDRVRRRLIPRTRAPGRVRNGGNGFGSLTNAGLLRVLRGKPNLTIVPKSNEKLLLLRHKVRTPQDVTLEDAIILYGAANQLNRNLVGKEAPTRPINKKEFRKLSIKDDRPLPQSQLVKGVLDSSLSRKNKKVAMHLLKTSAEPLSLKARRRLENIVSRPPREEFVSRLDLETLIRAEFNLEFGKRIAWSLFKERPKATPPPRKTVEKTQSLE